jgi:hypothetical protein
MEAISMGSKPRAFEQEAGEKHAVLCGTIGPACNDHAAVIYYLSSYFLHFHGSILLFIWQKSVVSDEEALPALCAA